MTTQGLIDAFEEDVIDKVIKGEITPEQAAQVLELERKEKVKMQLAILDAQSKVLRCLIELEQEAELQDE